MASQSLPPRLLRQLLQPLAPAAAAAAAAPALALAAGNTGVPQGLLDALQQRYNASQQAAIASAVQGFRPQAAPSAAGAAGPGASAWRPAGPAAGPAAVAAPGAPAGPCFALVQGPPGTGKTAAIIGMLSSFLVHNVATSAKAPPRQGSGDRDGSTKVTTTQRRGTGAGGPEVVEVINPTVRQAVSLLLEGSFSANAKLLVWHGAACTVHAALHMNLRLQ